MGTFKFTAAKGGQGVTVSAAAFAVRQAELGRKVHLLITPDTMPALGGIAPDFGGHVQVAPNLTAGWRIGEDGADCDVLVMDGDHHGPADHTILVTRPCFLALRRAMEHPALQEADTVLLINEEGRSLNERDVADCLGKPVISTPATPAAARAVDAGLLASRLPANLARMAERLLARPVEADAEA